MKKYLYIIIFVVAALVCVACSNDDNEEQTQVTLSFDLTLPVDAELSQTRVAGDPGITEYFERPQHLYLFLAEGEPNTPQDNTVYFFSIPCSQSDWKRSSDSLVFYGHFSQIIDWDKKKPLTEDTKLRAYIVASFDAIRTQPIITAGSFHKVDNYTERDLLDIKYYAQDDAPSYRLSLRDVYCTPYNLKANTTWTKLGDPLNDRTDYYGEVTDIFIMQSAAIISVKDTLYHNAAKVDFQWNATSHTQQNVMVGAVINNAPTMGYLFRPAERAVNSSYSKILLGSEFTHADDMNNSHIARYADADTLKVGNLWSGRAYTYVLQPGVLEYHVYSLENRNNPPLRTAVPTSNGSSNDIFAAWYKLDFMLRDLPVSMSK